MYDHGNTNTRRRTMKKLLFIFLTINYAFFTLANAASVEASVANTEVVAGNMAQLKITAHGDKAAFPNIREINGVQVLGRHESSNNSYAYINGKMSSDRSTTLILTFAPQKSLTIPSYSVNIDGTTYKTKPIDLKVVKASAPQVGSRQQFSLQLKINKKTAMVGEPVLATVYFSLQQGVQLSENPQYNKPEFKGFFVKEVGDQKNYTQGNRQVTELQYILVPKAEGNYTVGPATAKIGVADRNKRDMFGRFFGTNWHPIASNTIDIEVRPKPADTDLIGKFSIKSSVDKQQVKANKPVNLTVKISGKGSLEDFEFPAYTIDGVTVYSDDAKVDTRVDSGQIQSSYVKTFAFISDHDFTIPARNISVYDTESKTVTSLKIPSYAVKVEGSSAIVAAAKKTPSPHDGEVQTNLKSAQKSMLDSEEEKSAPKETLARWMLVLAFVSGLIVMYLLTLLPKLKFKTKSGSYKESDALKILYPHINESSDIEVMVRKLYAKKAGDKSVQIDKKELKEMIEKVQN